MEDFVKADHSPDLTPEFIFREAKGKLTMEQAEKLCEDLKKCTVLINDKYQVNVRMVMTDLGKMMHLSIKRIDKEVIHDWRDLQEIKNKIAGPDCEAVELYPAEDRLVDTANQYHLWVMAPGFRWPFGFNERLVMDHDPDSKAKQRPFK